MSFVRDTPLKTGFHPPEQCARGRSDCRSLAQIVSSDAATFVCCGEVAPGATPWPSDQWAFCLRGSDEREGVTGTDVRFFVDRRDMSHMAAVLAMGLATVIPPDDAPAPPTAVAEVDAVGARGGLLSSEAPRHQSAEGAPSALAPDDQ